MVCSLAPHNPAKLHLKLMGSMYLQFPNRFPTQSENSLTLNWDKTELLYLTRCLDDLNRENIRNIQTEN